MRMTGLSEAEGSWKIMPISLAAHAPHLALGEAEEIAPRRARRAPRRSAPASGTRRMIDSASIDLPQPDSPTMPTTSRGPTVKETAVDRLDQATRARDLDAQAFDGKDGIGDHEPAPRAADPAACVAVSAAKWHAA